MLRFTSEWLPLACSLVVLITFASCRPTNPDALPSSLEEQLRALIADQPPKTTIAVAVIDSSTGTDVEINADRVFHAASTMKVPVMIEVFRQAERGDISLEDSVLVENRFRSIVDGSLFSIEDDSDDALYTRSGKGVPIDELVRKMIVVSSNLATNLLVELVSADSVQRTMEELGTTTMRVYRGVEDLRAFDRGLNNTATAADLARLLDAIRAHRAVSPSASRQMIEILSGQEFNDMIPAGLPPQARAAHKTGSITGIAHDAAIIYPENGPPYTLVILTEGFESHDQAHEVGAEIARLVHETIRPTNVTG